MKPPRHITPAPAAAGPMAPVFIAGAGTDVGKTFVACGLIAALRRAGVATDALKPLVSGFDPADWAMSDPGRLLAALDRPLSPAALEAISPWRYAAPLAPDLAARLEGRAVDYPAAVALCRARIAEGGEGVLVIEGVGGVMSPLSETQTNLDLIEALGAPVVLVGGSYLGAISHTLTALAVLRARDVVVARVVISESAGDPPPLDETAASVTRLADDAAVLALPRDGDRRAAFDDLARRLRRPGELEQVGFRGTHMTSSRA